MERTWRCSCGAETPCQARDDRPGSVFRCPGCGVAWGRLTPRAGGVAWVRVDEGQVAFHRLFEEPEPE